MRVHHCVFALHPRIIENNYTIIDMEWKLAVDSGNYRNKIEDSKNIAIFQQDISFIKSMTIY